MIPSTKSQRQLIGIACNQLGIDKDLKAEMLQIRYGQSSTCDISKAQADEFMKELKARGFRVIHRHKKGGAPKRQRIPRAPGNLTAMVSKEELSKIAALSELVPWRIENGLAAWMQKRLGIARIRTGKDAYKIIEGLKKMFCNHMRKIYGEAWWIRIYPSDPGIETFIREHCPLDYRVEMWGMRRQAGMVSEEEYAWRMAKLMGR